MKQEENTMKRLRRIANGNRIVAVLVAAVVTGIALGIATNAPAATTALVCSGQTYSQPFKPWLDPANYVLLENGSLENSNGWTLSGGAKLAGGNESFYVNSTKDRYSLSLPSGSSATSPPICVTLLHPDLRFFAVNGGSILSTLKVEAITNVAGIKATTLVGLLTAGGSWRPTLPLPFLTNLLAPLSGPVSFRFTPVGSSSGWKIDDVYVDPYKNH